MALIDSLIITNDSSASFDEKTGSICVVLRHEIAITCAQASYHQQKTERMALVDHNADQSVVTPIQ